MKWREWIEGRKEFEAKLKAEFPMLYEGLGIHWREGGMLDGITVGPGWWDIVYEVSKSLEELMKSEPTFRTRVGQVKEKFGGLRFYIDGIGAMYQDDKEREYWFSENLKPESTWMEAVRLVSKAEKESLETCEYCGARPATTSDYHPWLKTLCAKCHEERKGGNSI